MFILAGKKAPSKPKTEGLSGDRFRIDKSNKNTYTGQMTEAIELTKDISYTVENQRFRYRAAALIIEEEALCLMRLPSEDYLYSVGGAVQFGETTEAACLREVLEETGQLYEIDRLAYIHENFFSNSTGILKDLDCHEICLCYFMKPKGQQFPSPDKLEKIQWIPIQDLKKHRIFPDFLPYFFTETDRGIQHFVTKN